MENPFSHLVLEKIYLNKEIKDIIDQKNLTPDNPAAYTYNRVNDGMTKLQPYFEHVGHGDYKYIGTPEMLKYSGHVIHYPKEGVPKQIGFWNKGEMQFLDFEIKDFKSWKSRKMPGKKIILENSRILLNINDENKKYTIKNTNEKGLIDNDGCLIISKSSKLAKLLLEKKEGDSFMFGNVKVEIIEIF